METPFLPIRWERRKSILAKKKETAPAVEAVKPTPEDKAQKAKEKLFAAAAKCIRDAAQQEKYVKLTELSTLLEADKANTLDLLDEMLALPEYEDLRMYKGSKDRYYYSYPTLANNYVKNCALAEEDNLEGTIAEIVRYESMRYPRATIIDTFTRFPYRYTKAQVKSAIKRMEKNADYEDLKTYESKQGNLYIYSTKSLTQRHAEALVEIAEDITQWF